jgi:uncharacterized protein (DUF2141 family)
MKKSIWILILYSSILFSHSITVHITNIHGIKGDILVGLYTVSENFTSIDDVYKQGKITKITKKRNVYKFINIPNGKYAISIFHDENRNNELDKYFLGTPKEGYGFSNNLRPILRSATFKESAFELSKDIELIIKIGY